MNRRKNVWLLFLTCLFFSLLPAFSARAKKKFTKDDASLLVVKSLEKMNFTAQETCFFLEIPEIQPSRIQTQMPLLPSNIGFISSRRMDYVSESGEHGTRLEYWFTFREKGFVTIPPLEISVDGRNYKIPFEKLYVYENPKTVMPEMVIKFSNGKTVSTEKKNEILELTAGESINFVVFIQYAVQVQQFSWTLPKDSLFREIQRFEITRGVSRGSVFSPEEIPVAEFEWVPLASGETNLPAIQMKVTTYAGRQTDLYMPECRIAVGKATVTAGVEDEEPENEIFGYAFSRNFEDEITDSKVPGSLEDFEEIARLRSLERHMFHINPDVRNRRILSEQKVGISNALNEPSEPLCSLLFSLYALFLVMAILLFVFKKKVAAIICISVAGCFGVLSIFAGVRTNELYGIVTGGFISPVPEDSALTTSSVSGGNRVRIVEEAGNWYYIKTIDNGGWIKKENIILIR